MIDIDNCPEIRNFARTDSDPACLVSVAARFVGSSINDVAINACGSRKRFSKNCAHRSYERGVILNIAENNEQQPSNNNGRGPSGYFAAVVFVGASVAPLMDAISSSQRLIKGKARFPYRMRSMLPSIRHWMFESDRRTKVLPNDDQLGVVPFSDLGVLYYGVVQVETGSSLGNQSEGGHRYVVSPRDQFREQH